MQKNVGLTTAVALTKLHHEISKELQRFIDHQGLDRPRCSWMQTAFHHNSAHSSFHWISGVFLFLEALLMIICYSLYKDPLYDLVIVNAFMILLLLILNCYAVGFDAKLRHFEVYERAIHMVHILKECIDTCDWKPCNYPHLNSPQSPCITLQWTYRDGELINMPWSLLVEGDVIAVRPGQKIPVKCKSIEDQNGKIPMQYTAGSVYAPVPEGTGEIFCLPKARTPLKYSSFIVQETPYIYNLRLSLNQSGKRPLSIVEKEKHVILSLFLQKIILPIVFFVILFTNVLRYVYLNNIAHWTEMLILLQLYAILPLIPIVFPFLWLLLNAYGVARLLAVFHIAKSSKKCPCYMPPFSDKNSSTPSPKVNYDPFDELEDCHANIPTADIKFQEMWMHFTEVLRGNAHTLSRTGNILHILGSVTALCCVDKKGILSWPHPTAEKVFFLRSLKTTNSSKHNNDNHSAKSIEETKQIHNGNIKDKEENEQEIVKSISRNCGYHESIVEVLDLTHDNQSAYGLAFDDPQWKAYISSLKPLGLNILLNTCNPIIQSSYTQYTDHISCVALQSMDAVPVVNRRCLCELARQIGFSDQVLNIFKHQQQLAIYRNLPEETPNKKHKIHKSHSFVKHKTPLPNMLSAVVKELNTGFLQLMSQGTADIVLDSCSDFWDGQDLRPLTDADRKKILDFYTRTSLTSYCTAYSYRPLTQGFADVFSDIYIEVPVNFTDLYPFLRSPTPTRSWDVHSLESHLKSDMHHSYSDSSLANTDFLDRTIKDVNSCFKAQCNQIFIGMVTMQYQARTDIVQMIEHLDMACIRFVHFSEENELRSRVFSEKMGLESGWNCHISLLNEEQVSSNNAGTSLQTADAPSTAATTVHRESLNKPSHGFSFDNVEYGSEAYALLRFKDSPSHTAPRSNSAPSAINIETATVKFEDEINLRDITDTSMESPNTKSPDNDRTIQKDQDSFMSGLSSEDLNVHEDLEEDSGKEDDIFLNKEVDGDISRSASHVTTSTEHSAPGGFDMSNRAKLPKGIENMRPHIEKVDNVPLQVSLFTDCTHESIQEMIKIMQEYGEVVCCMGSSAKFFNAGIFLQADASIAVEPLYPQPCMKQPAFIKPPKEHGPAPTEISRMLNCLPCSLCFHREDPISIVQLIMEARHFTASMRNCFLFMLACYISLSLIQILASIFLFPPVFTGSQLLWLICLVVPLLSLSLMGNPLDQHCSTIATGKNSNLINREMVLYFLYCFSLKFLPSVIVALICYGLILASFCEKLSRPNETCHPLLGNINREHWYGWGKDFYRGWIIAQNSLTFLLVFYFCITSMSFVHRSHSIWKKHPFTNMLWCVMAPLVIVLQILFFAVDLALRSKNDHSSIIMEDIPLATWLVAFIWPLILLAISEIAKIHEINLAVRYQKRARLDFTTKLGMNSPF